MTYQIIPQTTSLMEKFNILKNMCILFLSESEIFFGKLQPVTVTVHECTKRTVDTPFQDGFPFISKKLAHRVHMPKIFFHKLSFFFVYILNK